MHEPDSTPAERAIALATEFLSRVWGPAHDLDAIDELMTEDYRIWSGGKLVSGRRSRSRRPSAARTRVRSRPSG